MTEENEINKIEEPTENIKTTEEGYNNSNSNSSLEEAKEAEAKINSQNIYTTEEEIEVEETETIEDNNLADFTQENLSIFKDSFKASKITQDEFDDFMDKIADICGEEKFTEVVIDTFGEDNYMNEINLYREATKNIFTPEEKSLINDSPAQSKILLMKTVNAIAKENRQIKKDYGLKENITKALPQRTPEDNRKEFSNILNRLLKGDYRTPEEFEALKQQRIELASRIINNNN